MCSGHSAKRNRNSPRGGAWSPGGSTAGEDLGKTDFLLTILRHISYVMMPSDTPFPFEFSLKKKNR